MDDAFGVEAERFLADRDVAGESAVEILSECFQNARADALAQCFADLDIFS